MVICSYGLLHSEAEKLQSQHWATLVLDEAQAIKNTLTNHKFIAGIGNAYSDEILFEARLDPFRKRSTMSDDDIGRLYHAIHKTMNRSIPILREHFREELDYKEWREHLKIHKKGAKPGAERDEGRCPRCGLHIGAMCW